MHPNPAFRQTPTDRNLAFARDRGFGILTVNGTEGPLAAHVPFLLSPDGSTLDLHLAPSNPIVRAARLPVPALVAVPGPDAYVSPDWYALDHQVPTWNYVAVHLRGMVEIRPDGELPAHLDGLSAEFERRLAPKPAWLTTKLPAETFARMMRQIVPVRLAVTEVHGTWKLAQNKPEAARLAAADAMRGSRVGGDPATIANLMRDGG